MRLTSFIAGAFGTLGFVLSIAAGLLADNPTESILLKAMMFGGICYVIGYGVGLVAQQVSSEHAQRLARKVAEQDAADETKRLEQTAELEAQTAGRTPAEAATVMVPATAPKP